MVHLLHRLYGVDSPGWLHVLGQSTQDWTFLFSDEFSTDGMELQFSQYQHQSTPVPSTDKVCSALWYRNRPIWSLTWIHWRLSTWVSVTDTWCMLVGSCLQCRGASVIWFANHWWHLTSSTLISGHVARLNPGVPAHDALRLMVDWIPTKAERQWPAGERRRVALATSGSTRFRRMPINTLLPSTLWRFEITKGHGAAQQFTQTTRRQRDDDDNGDDDEGWLESKMEGAGCPEPGLLSD